VLTPLNYYSFKVVKSRNIRFLIVFASLALIGISIAQVYWVRQAFRQEVDHFHKEVNTALNEVAEGFYNFLNVTRPAFSPIRQLTGNYYVVRIDGPIDANMLELMLRQSFSKRNIRADFEYGIYDCETEGMVFDKFVDGNDLDLSRRLDELPVWDETNYYFGVYFPGQERYILGQMGIWGFTSLVMIIVILFFSYGMFVILQQKRLSEVQRDFINNMTHEFRTPISTIEVASSVLQGEDVRNDPGRLMKYATIINKENERLKKQVDRVLQLASIENDQINLKMKKVSLHSLVIEIISHQKAANEQIEISSNLSATNDLIIGDPLHLTNVFYNLVDNSIKYSHHPVISISSANDKDKIIIKVEDNGVGIAAKELASIFNKFYRVNTGNRHDVKGFGIGLSYVKSVIEAHQGTVVVDSIPGKGSIFTLSLKIDE